VVQPILGNVTPAYAYDTGSWGPNEALQLIGADGPWIDPQVPSQDK
jgi:glucose-6-phosphate 1-dehydrogenase